MDKKENIKKILEKIQEAEYVLVGLGQYLICSIFYPCRRVSGNNRKITGKSCSLDGTLCGYMLQKAVCT